MKRVLAVVGVMVAVLGLTAGVAMAESTDEGFEIGGSTNAIGGLFFSSDGRLEYRVPADAYLFADRVKIKYGKPGLSNLAPLPSAVIPVGDPFHLEMREWDDNIQLSYRKPASIIVHYKPEELGGRPESWLRLIRYFDSWVEMPTTLDTVNHTITTQVPYGGDYVLVAYNSEPPAPPPAPAGSGRAAAAPAPAPTGSSVSGRIFWDKNGDGAFNGDDRPVGTAAIRIGNDNFNALTSTNPDGTYSFTGLPAGTYTLNLVVGAEWDFTTPSEVAGISLTGQPDSSPIVNFGMTYKSWYTPQ